MIERIIGRQTDRLMETRACKSHEPFSIKGLYQESASEILGGTHTKKKKRGKVRKGNRIFNTGIVFIMKLNYRLRLRASVNNGSFHSTYIE